MRFRLLLLVVLSSVAALPSTASAAPAPPNDSLVYQYLETIPGPGGGNDARGGPARALPASVRARLTRQGGLGRLAAEVLPATGSPAPRALHPGTRQPAIGQHRRTGHPGRHSADARSEPSDDHPKGGLGAFVDVLLGQGSNGAGALLPGLLLVLALAAGAVALRRRSSTAADS